MANAWELNTIARDANFQRRVINFMSKAAVAVMAESSTTPGYDLRIAYAKAVLRGEVSITQIDPQTQTQTSPADPQRHGQAALSNPTVAGNADINQPSNGYFNIDDPDLEFAINEVWNAMSGVKTG